ncbi:MAG: hypothetical protein DIZ80_12100 [endosymbiont of Galathealinum brachiosum]|uniref:Uncharacterized protein n=1 Tax=endosymbiont of Galathealinum brachiosum TaxID=2200906 RepID=A0A370DDL1_9GAMM|nr:MAG: hypothetical protein DIZ80_12100 [endosymbiont of Galathealinum brachiosum]
MINAKTLKKTTQLSRYIILLSSLLVLLAFTQAVFAEGIFEDRKKAQHKLTGADLNRIKAEHQLKFGQTSSSSPSYKSNNPWEKKKKTTQSPKAKANWGECRDYALHKRNRCYREGRDAYRCEQMYETRSRLCDNSL